MITNLEIYEFKGILWIIQK